MEYAEHTAGLGAKRPGPIFRLATVHSSPLTTCRALSGRLESKEKDAPARAPVVLDFYISRAAAGQLGLSDTSQSQAPPVGQPHPCTGEARPVRRSPNSRKGESREPLLHLGTLGSPVTSLTRGRQSQARRPYQDREELNSASTEKKDAVPPHERSLAHLNLSFVLCASK